MQEIRLHKNLSSKDSEDRSTTLARLLSNAGQVSKPAANQTPGSTKEHSPINLWIESVQTGDDELAKSYGFTPFRDLWKMTCPLPLLEPKTEKGLQAKQIADQLQIHSFTPKDTAAFLKTQNLAFAWHPEEADMDEAELKKRFQEPWYDPKDFLLLKEGADVLGFCWTKIHSQPPAGEIYMIGIHPSQQGRKLGEALTRRGLEHLAAKGQALGMLYVESDNYPAIAIYERLGMKLSEIDRAYTNQAPTKHKKQAQSILPDPDTKRAFVSDMFDRIAKRYEIMNSVLTFGLDKHWRRKTLRALDIPPNGRLADLACGTGSFVFDLNKLEAKKAKPKKARAKAASIHTVGFDFSTKMLDIANAKARSQNTTHPTTHLTTHPVTNHWIAADITSIPVPDQTFDAAVMGFALRNLVDIPLAIQEISRILRPKSRLAILEVGIPRNPLLRTMHSLYFRRIVPFIGGVLSDKTAYKYLPESITYLPSSTTLKDNLQQSGFHQIQMRSFTGGAVNLTLAIKLDE